MKPDAKRMWLSVGLIGLASCTPAIPAPVEGPILPPTPKTELCPWPELSVGYFSEGSSDARLANPGDSLGFFGLETTFGRNTITIYTNRGNDLICFRPEKLVLFNMPEDLPTV